jgi:hypothetical protein
MSVDLFEFWSKISDTAKTHPADLKVFSHVKNAHNFDRECLPHCFIGKLKHAPVVLLYLSPGLEDYDKKHSSSEHGRKIIAGFRTGIAPLPEKDDHESAWKWWTSRTKIFGENSENLRNKIAFLNIGAYLSKTFTDHHLLAALPSSRVCLDWAQNVLFPEAEEGKRIVVCMRSAKYWGLFEGTSKEHGRKFGESLYVPKVNRGGYMLHKDPDDKRFKDEIIAKVKAMLKS